MSGTTVWFGIALVVLGIAFYVLTGSRVMASLAPAAFGVLLIILGKLAETPVGSHRRAYVVAAAVIALVGCVAAVVLLFGGKPDIHSAVLIEKAAMALLTLIFLLLCVRFLRSPSRLDG